jgi:hypothetical protein
MAYEEAVTLAVRKYFDGLAVCVRVPMLAACANQNAAEISSTHRRGQGRAHGSLFHCS